jgi:hypothetical protein
VDLTAGLLRVAAGRPRPLLVPVPGGTAARLAVERELRRRSWPPAISPAEAGLLVICGVPGTGWAPVLDELWGQLPSPRARVDVRRGEETAAALEAGRVRLADAVAQRADLADRMPAGTGRHGGQTAGGHQMDHAQHMGGHEHEMGHGQQMDHGGHGMHGDHEMHGGMAMPAGLAMAGRAPDRDGLVLDQLHISLGPVLADWPAGLILRVALQGDVVQEAAVEVLDGGGRVEPFWDEPWRQALAGGAVTRGVAARRRAACHLDSLARLLAVAGWDGAALTARRLRDDLLAGVPGRAVDGHFARLSRRVGRSRLLAWLTRGLGVLTPEVAAIRGIGGPALRAGGDVAARWRRWLEETAAALAEVDEPGLLVGDAVGEGPRGPLGAAAGDAPGRALLEVLPELVVGAELAAVRLVVASLDPDIDELAVARELAGA